MMPQPTQCHPTADRAPLTTALLALALCAPAALAQSTDAGTAAADLGAELAKARGLLEQAQADARAKADAVANLERSRADLEAQLVAARKETEAARAAVEKAQSESSEKAAAIATLEQGRAELQAAVEAERARLAASETQANDRLAAAEKAAAEKLAEAERRLRAQSDAQAVAERQLADLTRRLSAVEMQAASLEKERDAATTKLNVALGKLGVRDGGTRTVEQARAAAATAGTAFVAASERARKERSDDAKAALRNATTVLQQAQYDVAVAIDARGVYRMREEDTLGMVSGRFYGAGNKWPAIYEANQHVLANPDRMYPGMTLVVP